MNRICFIFIVLYITAVLVYTVQLRTSQSQSFYRFRAAYIKQAALKKLLWQQQLRLERLTNPNAVSETVEQEEK